MSAATPAGPLLRSRWPFRRAAFALSVTAFGAGAPTPLYVTYEAQYHFGSGVLTGIFAIYTAGVVATMLLVAPMSDVLGRRPVLYLGLALTAASGFAWILASGIPTLALARFTSGLAVGATTSTATATMAALEPRGDQHHVARVSVAANFGGVASGTLLSGLLVEYAPDPRTLIYLVLIGASLLGIAGIELTPETVRPRPFRVAARVQRLSIPAALRLPFWVAAGSLAACYAIYGLFSSLAPTFLRVDLGVTNVALAAAAVAVLFAAASIAQLGLGQVRDRRALLLGLPLILAGLLLFVLSLAISNLPGLVAGAAVVGTGIAFAEMGSVTLIDRVAPGEERGEILSAYFLVGYLALAVPTLGVGLAAEAFGLRSAALSFGLLLGAFVAALFLLLRRTPTPAGGGGWPPPSA